MGTLPSHFRLHNPASPPLSDPNEYLAAFTPSIPSVSHPPPDHFVHRPGSHAEIAKVELAIYCPHCPWFLDLVPPERQL